MEKCEEEEQLYSRDKSEILVFGDKQCGVLVNLIWHDFILWKLFHLWNNTTISVDCECKGATAVGSRRRSTFPYIEVISILGNSFCNSKTSGFQINLSTFIASKRSFAKMAAIMLQTIPSFHAKISEDSRFIFAVTYEKNIVCKDYCIAHHDDKNCSLPACNYHFILLEEFEELLHKLDTFCFTYQHVDCLYTLFNYRFGGKIIAKTENVFDNVQTAISFNQRNRGVNKMPTNAKKKLLRKKFKQHFMSALQKNKSTQTSGSVFEERLEKVKKTKIE